ncbi:BT1 folate biopterin transporter family related [Babesia ovis]|uniref:BT1 folate biopterin transporter family related n=1 Tax=Babesia ovis TaxID=5869 RepID=A0A9W5T884_BABOV|nr:BT1 folate biopterin transporter family related [Babesia ovis]
MKAVNTIGKPRLLRLTATACGSTRVRSIGFPATLPCQYPAINIAVISSPYLATGSTRNYVNLGRQWKPVRNQYTKYRITKPWTADSTYDDIFLAEPSREDLYAFSKEMPLFLKFLKLLTKAQNRKEAFVEFAKRCENGLVVEKDVYVTKNELVDCMWRNGYTEEELDAVKLGFPDDYRFHYPELAVMFELSEEDCYKYCLKQRASNPEELVELKLKKPQNMISSYGLIFLGCWFGLSNAVLGNAWFFAKTLPFGAVFYMLAAYFQKTLKEMAWKEENALIDKAKEEKDYCEDAIYNQLSCYMDTSKCEEYVDRFKDEVANRMKEYRMALLQHMKSESARLMNERLQSMLLQETAMSRSVQKTMVDELMAVFRETFTKNTKLQDAAISSAISEIAGEPSKRDPVFTFFNDGLASFRSNKPSEIVKRCKAAFEAREREFLDSFTVGEKEAAEVSALAKQCKNGDNVDLTRLSEEQLKRAQQLFETFNQRFGYYVPDVAGAVAAMGRDGEVFIDNINKEVARCAQEVRQSRLSNFLRAFF